jgi:glutamine synthetase
VGFGGLGNFGHDVEDQVLVPDEESLRILPWRPDVAVVLCDVDDLGPCFRSMARRATTLETNGDEIRGVAGIEAGVHVGRRLDNRPDSLTPLIEHLPPTPVFDLSSTFAHSEVIDRVWRYATALGIDIEASHHESAVGQLEFVISPKDPVEAADEMIFLGLTFEAVSQELGVVLSRAGDPFGTGDPLRLHINLSMNGSDGLNCFGRPGQATSSALQGCAGILQHLGGLLALAMPYPDAYEKPINVGYSRHDRRAPLRLPLYRAAIEFRHADLRTNCYLLLAGLFAAIGDGMASGMAAGDPWAPGEQSGRVIASFDESIQSLEQDDLLRTVLGSSVHANLVALLRSRADGAEELP